MPAVISRAHRLTTRIGRRAAEVTVDSKDFLRAVPIKETLTSANGSYVMCLPTPIGGTGGTGPGGQPFEVRARQNGYLTASQSFRFAYSVWDYGGAEVSLLLEPAPHEGLRPMFRHLVQVVPVLGIDAMHLASMVQAAPHQLVRRV